MERTPEQKAKAAAYQREYRKSREYTPEQKAKRAENSRKWRASRTPEQRAELRVKHTVYEREWEANLTPEQRADRSFRRNSLERQRRIAPEIKAKKREQDQAQYRTRHHRDWRFRRTYGISVDDYEAMLENQNGLCAICRCEPMSRQPSVDHDHACCPGKTSCGKCVRGLLCDYCNRYLLGHLKDSIETLERAIQYLQNPPGVPQGQQLMLAFG